VIWECLRLNDPNCAITEKCVLEGELLVYSDKVSLFAAHIRAGSLKTYTLTKCIE